TLPGVFLTPVLGVLADRWGRKTVLIPSLLLVGVAGTACAFTRSFALLLVFRFFHGVGSAALGSLNLTIIGDIFEGRRRTAAMGYNGGVLTVGTATYPLVGGALANFGWNVPFFLPLLALPVALAAWLWMDLERPDTSQTLGTYLKGTLQNIGDPRLIGLFFANFALLFIIFGAYISYFPFVAKQFLGNETLKIGMMMGVAGLTTAATSFSLGFISRFLSERRLLHVGFALYMIGLLLIPFGSELWQVIPPLVLMGLGQGLGMPTIFSLLSSLAPMERRGAVMSVNGTVLRIGQTLGPLAMGGLYGLAGLYAPFYAAAVLAGVMQVGLYILVTRRMKKA
ncbi:MFS transporter, partial [bacterium]|nr:MFS transporter [bacterium]